MIDSATEFVRLRTSEDPADYGRASHEEAPIQVWFEVIESFPDMRVWVAQNKTVPLEVLETLARDDDPRVRSMVARKRKLTPALLEFMSVDNSDAVRMAVARHKKTPDHTLRNMAEADPWSKVRSVASGRLG